ncbi:50S ribosomal protein L34e [Candidatus Woesearchaeota archaeon]|nr:50S ribosomal protein L34e [Candidatus Woesearchaeota archaeon]
MPGNKSKTKPKVASEGRYGRLKSRRGLRMLYVRTPGSRTTIHFKRKKPSKTKCGKCGKVLAGVPHGLQHKTKNLPKTKKRPERPYGGVLCSQCTRLLLKTQARTKK